MWASWATPAAQGEMNVSGCCISISFVGKNWSLHHQFEKLWLHSCTLLLVLEQWGLLCVQLSEHFMGHACNFSLAWVFCCLILSSMVRTAVLFWFPFLGNAWFVWKCSTEFFHMFLFPCLLFLKSPRIIQCIADSHSGSTRSSPVVFSFSLGWILWLFVCLLHFCLIGLVFQLGKPS